MRVIMRRGCVAASLIAFVLASASAASGRRSTGLAARLHGPARARWACRRRFRARAATRRPSAPAGSGSCNGKVDTSLDVQMYDVDGFNVSKAARHDAARAGQQGRLLHQRRVVGELATRRRGFPVDPCSGRSNGWPGERWLDIRRLDVLRPIMKARLDMCAAKGFDAVEFDNVDGYQNRTGFPLTGADQLALRRLPGEPGAPAGAVGGAQERPRPDPRARCRTSTSR